MLFALFVFFSRRVHVLVTFLIYGNLTFKSIANMGLLQRKEPPFRALLPKSQASVPCPISSSTRSTSAATPTSRARRT